MMRWPAWIFSVILSITAVSLVSFAIWQVREITDAVSDYNERAIGLTRNLDEVDTLFSGLANSIRVEITSVEDQIDVLSARISEVTTEEINSRLAEIDVDVGRIKGELETFQRVIDPETAQDILNVARLADEIAARERFEQEIREHVGAYDERMERIDARIWDFQLVILGAVVTVLVAVVGGFAYLIKRDRAA